MRLPIVCPSPLVSEHSQVFRKYFNDKRQFRHFENYLTGLMVLEEKSLANISRCILDSAGKSNLSRFLSAAPWSSYQINETRIQYLQEKTESMRLEARESNLIIDDTLCEHVGSLFEHIDRHHNHSQQTFPLAHNLVTSHYVSGAVRFPVDLQWYERYETITQWESFVVKHFPEHEIPKNAKARAALHKQLAPQLMKDAAFAELAQQFCSKIALGTILVDHAIEQGLGFSTVLFDSWYLSPELVQHLRHRDKDWVSLLKGNRNLDSESIHLKDEWGQRIRLPGPQIKVEALMPWIPKSAFRPISIKQRTYWCFTFTCRMPTLGKVRLVISFEDEDLKGTYAVLVSNRTDWGALTLLSKYLSRWPIETFYWDGKQHLGLGEYRMRTIEAIQSHWHLVFVVYSILHLACLPPPKRGQSKRSALPNKTIGQVCRQQSQFLIEKLILFAHERLSDGTSIQELCHILFAKQNREAIA
jgi:hypothetical protein